MAALTGKSLSKLTAVPFAIAYSICSMFLLIVNKVTIGGHRCPHWYFYANFCPPGIHTSVVFLESHQAERLTLSRASYSFVSLRFSRQYIGMHTLQYANVHSSSSDQAHLSL